MSLLQSALDFLAGPGSLGGAAGRDQTDFVGQTVEMGELRLRVRRVLAEGEGGRGRSGGDCGGGGRPLVGHFRVGGSGSGRAGPWQSRRRVWADPRPGRRLARRAGPPRLEAGVCRRAVRRGQAKPWSLSLRGPRWVGGRRAGPLAARSSGVGGCSPGLLRCGYTLCGVRQPRCLFAPERSSPRPPSETPGEFPQDEPTGVTAADLAWQAGQGRLWYFRVPSLAS